MYLLSTIYIMKDIKSISLEFCKNPIKECYNVFQHNQLQRLPKASIIGTVLQTHDNIRAMFHT